VDTDIAIITVKKSSKSSIVYADEVLWIKLMNATDPDDSGVGEDITTKFLDYRVKSNKFVDLLLSC
jgi:hypothetical protein